MTTRERILVVDDETEACELLAEVLASEGYVVETAPDGKAALARLATFPADLILTDYQMPGMNGVELIKRIHDEDPRRPTLLMTGYVDSGRLGGGVAKCLLKPMEVDDLVWLIDCELACHASVRRP